MANQDINFVQAVKTLLGIEGGYSNNPNDLGGETNYGISKRQYPQLDIKNLNPLKAADIYYNDYWLRYRINEVNDPEVARILLLAFVNLKPESIGICVQKAINKLGGDVQQDGIVGSETIKLINKLSPRRVADNLRLELVKFYLGRVMLNKTQLVNFAGWIRRALL